jgi:membrane protein implicated in regulation of membrane protease activity
MEIGHWMMDHQWAVWLIVAVLLVLLEMFSLDLVFLMLSIGALFGLGVSLFTDDFVIQVLVAIVVALAMLFLIRPPMVRRLHRGEDLTSGAQGLVGKQGFVLEPMSANQTGRVKIGGDEWSALPEADMTIPAGTQVTIVAISGATAIVSMIP